MGCQIRKVIGPYTQLDKTELMLDLPHEKYGLAIYIVRIELLNKRILLLRPAEFELEFFLQELTSETEIYGTTGLCSKGQSKIEINRENVDMLLNSMDTEYDKNVARVILSAGRSRAQIDELGINADNIVSLSEKVALVGQEVKNSLIAAEDLVKLHIKGEIGKLQTDTERLQHTLLEKQGDWTDTRLGDIGNHLDGRKQRLKHLTDVVECKDKYHQRLFNNRVKRKAVELIEENRLKRRKLTNQGRERLIDSDKETLIEKLIEDKATYHGRHQHAVMYTHKRVKIRDLKDSLNYLRSSKGKPLIRSATTIYNRSRPKSIRALLAKRHIGKGLFCFKKPPKIEDSYNQNTHHQLSHVNNANIFLFSSKHQKEATKYAIIHSKNDKAYVRPGTCEGLEKTRNVKILTLSVSSRARKLPLHDFPEAKVYCTPAAHHIIRKATIEVDGSVKKLITQEDTHFAFSRPKHYTLSHGTTWANEDIRCSHLYPQKFEVDEDTQYTTEFRSVCRVISNSIVYFLDTSVKKILRE